MVNTPTVKRIGILGGGPSALFIYKALIESGQTGISITIFEKNDRLGQGMPYSINGAGNEHITNVSGNEIPQLVTSSRDWLRTVPADRLTEFGIDPKKFSDYMVFPRLLFGEYLQAQFEMLTARGIEAGFDTAVHYNTEVTDVIADKENRYVTVKANASQVFEFDDVIICTGHRWPLKFEGRVDGYYDSPYPPAKLRKVFNHPVAVRGSSLTAIDAIRTIARHNGQFTHDSNNRLVYKSEQPEFRIDMHSIDALLPGVRFHLEDTHLSADSLLTEEEILQNIIGNDGFLSLDFIFDRDFKQVLKKKDPVFYESIRDIGMEEFVERMMSRREGREAFALLREEYAEAAESIKKKRSVHWKEMLAVLSFAMNYPAKHFSAEDMQRLQKTLMPLISIVIAFIPQSSCEEMLALHDAGVLDLVSVDKKSKVDAHREGGITYHYNGPDGKEVATRYLTYVDAIGQPRLMLEDFPFKSLVEEGILSEAVLKFRDPMNAQVQLKEGVRDIVEGSEGDYFLKVPGIAITDNFRVIGKDGYHHPAIRIMAVPYIGGYNPDYSGLDFCEEASKHIVTDLFST